MVTRGDWKAISLQNGMASWDKRRSGLPRGWRELPALTNVLAGPIAVFAVGYLTTRSQPPPRAVILALCHEACIRSAERHASEMIYSREHVVGDKEHDVI